MSVEELQKRIEELEQELEPLRKYKDCCVVQYYGKEHFESELETLDIDRELTDEDFISISNKVRNDEYMLQCVGERLTEIIEEWNEENEEELVNRHCECGQPANPNDICGHGYADGVCCSCPECRKLCESEDSESEDSDSEYIIKCSLCLKKKQEDDIQNCPQCEEGMCIECIEGDKCAELEIDEETCETILFCHSSCVEHYKVKNNIESEEEEEIENKCSQCPTILNDDCPIFIMTNQFTNEEETVCECCRYDIKWEFGWIDDTEEEIDISDLSKFKVKELKVICKSKGIKGYSKLKKKELLQLLGYNME